MDIGFIGLGNMGAAIARNLIKAGHRLTVYNRSRNKAEALAKDGAIIADSPADAARSASRRSHATLPGSRRSATAPAISFLSDINC